MKTILLVPKSGLCTGCGTCAGICPNEAIKMYKSEGLYLPKIDEEKCNQCGICVRSCPGYSVDFWDLNSKIFGKQPEDKLIGNYFGCYIGHSIDKNIRYNSSSGGIATQLLIYALENGIIDGALVVRMRKDKPLEPEPFIARTKEEVLSASKSKYCPVAGNEVLKKILREDGRFAVVGLPCHIHGIRKAEEINKELKNKIVLHIGLLCSHTVNFNGTELIFKKLNIKKEQVVEFRYRGNGWPGSLLVKVRGGSSLYIPFFGTWNSYWSIFSSFFFTPMRCIMCPDQTCELADISLGDAWLPELKGYQTGESIIVTRKKIAEKILESMNKTKKISINKISSEKVKQSQKLSLKFKKDDFNARLSMIKAFGKQIPSFNNKTKNSWNPIRILRNLYAYINIRLSSNEYVKYLLRYVPFPLFRIYFGLYKFITYI